jgi:FAD:protein FMN transferase
MRTKTGRLRSSLYAAAACTALLLAWAAVGPYAADVVLAQPATGGLSVEYRYLMGTSVQVRAFGGDEPTRQRAIDEAFAAMAEVDRLMSNWRADSELTALNTRAAAQAVHVSDALLSVIEAGQQVSQRSAGAFDLTIGPAVKLWGFRDRKPHVPTAGELETLRPVVSYRNVEIDHAARTVRFARPGMEIDLGGIAKGFAVELAAAVLRRRGLTGYIDAGGNQFMLGRPPGKSAWTVGIRDPDHADRLLGELELDEGSVSTSATYANFLIKDGRIYGHIIDPRTLQPTDACLSATAYSPDGTLADALSTAAFVLGPSRGLALLDSYPQMAGLIAYRQPDGSIGVVMSERLRSHFHRVATPSTR